VARISLTTKLFLSEVAMKECFRCNQIKPLSEFYSHGRMRDGHLNKCKECTKDDVRKHYFANIERYREYERGRANLPHRVEAREAYAQTPQGRANGSRAKRSYLDRNPLKRAAHVAVGNALRDGKLTRNPCEVCGEAKAQAHHDDYSKPLDVRWLCTTHHAEWHKHNTPKCPPQTQEKAA
jgi:hypothetical protein